jgi:uncharacterized FlaG/YvyC family protein
MKETDEYKLCSLEEAEAFAQKRADYIKHLEEGLESSLALNKAQAEKISNMEIWEKKYLDRIEELEKELQRIQANAEFELDRAYTTPQIKELSDEEIHQIFRDESGFEIDTCPIAILDFARAILKKASEK